MPRQPKKPCKQLGCPRLTEGDYCEEHLPFLEAYRLLAVNFDDVLESVLDSIEDTISNDEDQLRLKRNEKALSNLEHRRKKLTDMLLDDIISKDAYDEKYNDFTARINKCKEEREIFMTNLDSKKNITKRMKDLREKMSDAEVVDQFDRIVFESIVEKVIVGEVKEDGTIDPYKLTFILKGNGYKAIPDAKVRYMNLGSKVN